MRAGRCVVLRVGGVWCEGWEVCGVRGGRCVV